jgi:hypothetical protein
MMHDLCEGPCLISLGHEKGAIPGRWVEMSSADFATQQASIRNGFELRWLWCRVLRYKRNFLQGTIHQGQSSIWALRI